MQTIQKNLQQQIMGKYFAEKYFKDFVKDKNFEKVREHCHFTGKNRGAEHSICNLRFIVPSKIPVIFHKSSNYYYHFIVKEFASKFEGQFECLGENKEKQKTFFFNRKRSSKVNKDGNESLATISCKMKFFDSASFMTSSLSSLVDNLVKGIHKIKCDIYHEYEVPRTSQ